jgi:hypothetical protein
MTGRLLVWPITLNGLCQIVRGSIFKQAALIIHACWLWHRWFVILLLWNSQIDCRLICLNDVRCAKLAYNIGLLVCLSASTFISTHIYPLGFP